MTRFIHGFRKASRRAERGKKCHPTRKVSREELVIPLEGGKTAKCEEGSPGLPHLEKPPGKLSKCQDQRERREDSIIQEMSDWSEYLFLINKNSSRRRENEGRVKCELAGGRLGKTSKGKLHNPQNYHLLPCKAPPF